MLGTLLRSPGDDREHRTALYHARLGNDLSINGEPFASRKALKSHPSKDLSNLQVPTFAHLCLFFFFLII